MIGPERISWLHARGRGVSFGQTPRYDLPAKSSVEVWYKPETMPAVGTLVGTWADASGHGRNATQATVGKQPTVVANAYYDYPAVRFERGGLSSYGSMSLNFSGFSMNSQAGTMMAVIQWNGIDKPGNLGGQNAETVISTNPGQWGLLFDGERDSGGSASRSKLACYDGSWTAYTEMTNLGACLVGLVGDTSQATEIINMNTYVKAAFGASSQTAGSLGSVGTDYYFSGDYLEVVYWSKALSSAEILQAQLYFNSRYGLQPPGALVIWDGNSIPSGQFSGTLQNVPNLIDKEQHHRHKHIQNSLPGITTTTIAAQAAGATDPYLDRSRLINVVILWEIINDLVSNGSATTTYNNVVAYCNARRAAGWKVVVATCPAASAIGTDSLRLSVNSSIVSNWATFADALADIGGDAIIGNAANTGNTTYFADGVHLTGAGHARCVPYFKTALAFLGVV